MVNGKSKERFDKSEEELLEIAPEEFRTYYVKNWGHCPEMWATYAMDDHQHLGNTTTNRIESFHQKLKNTLRKDMSVAECVSDRHFPQEDEQGRYFLQDHRTIR